GVPLEHDLRAVGRPVRIRGMAIRLAGDLGLLRTVRVDREDLWIVAEVGGEGDLAVRPGVRRPGRCGQGDQAQRHAESQNHPESPHGGHSLLALRVKKTPAGPTADPPYPAEPQLGMNASG